MESIGNILSKKIRLGSLLVLLMVFVSDVAVGQITSNNTTTDWSTTTGWSCTCVPDMTFWDGSIDVEVSHNKSTSGTLQIEDFNRLTVKSGATVTVNGDLEIGSNGQLLIENGGTLIVTGQVKGIFNAQTNSPSEIKVDAGGVFNVTGNVTIGGSGINYIWAGQVSVGGNLNIYGNTAVTVSGGTIAVTGRLDVCCDGHISGATGTITYGTYNLLGSGKVTCGGTLHNGTDGGCDATKSCVGSPTLESAGFSFVDCGPPCSAPVAGAIASAQTICYNTSPAAFTETTVASGGDGTYTYAWQSSTDNATWGAAAGSANSTTHTSGALTTSTYFRRAVTSCSLTSYTASVLVTVNADLTAGAIAAAQTICYNTSPAAFTSTTAATGGTGAYTYAWQSSTDNATWGAAAGSANSATHTSGALTTSTYFRRSATSGTCGTVYTASVLVTVYTDLAAGAVAASQSICYNTAPAAFTSTTAATGGTGAYTYAWESSTDNAAWGAAAGTADSPTYTSGALTANTYFRRSATDGTCGTVYTASVLITVYGNLTSGTVGAAQTINVGATPSTLTETVAHTGGVAAYTYLWESSTDNATWANATGTNTNATYTAPGALSTDTWYRRTVTSGSSCGSATTASVKITVNMSVCSGSAPSAISSGNLASGGDGSAPTYQWESSTDGITFTDIVGQTGDTLTPGSITVGTTYRRKAIVNGCIGYSNVLNASINGGSPGGVSSGLLVWLKSNAGTGSLATQWEDQSGNGNHYITASGPVLEAGNSSSNFWPYVKILSGGFDAPAGAALGANYTIIVAAKKLPSAPSGRLIDGHTGNYNFAFSGTDTTKMVQVITSASLPASGVRVDINTGNANGDCDANIFELIIYNRVVHADTIAIIESYLETKYGIEDNDNYLSSTGAITYNVSSYANDIIGLGKECYFHQKQSRSVDDSVKVFISTLAATNGANAGTITNDASYLMLGHNGGLLIGTAAANLNVPPAGTDGHTVSSRIERQWKVTNTNFNNAFTIKFLIKNQASVGAADLANLCLIVSDKADFTDMTGNPRVYGQNQSGVVFSLGSIDVLIPAAIIPAGAAKFIAIGAVDPATALPVELTQFKVSEQDDYNLITWITESEINNSHFVIEKSNDGINWESLTIVSGAGNSNTKINYSFADYEQCLGKCYYRLQQVDFSGENSYSQIEFIDNSKTKTSYLKVYPIPVKDKAVVEFTVSTTGVYELEIFTASGARLFISKVICAEGENVFDINTNIYSSGMYYMVIKDVNGEVMNRITFTK